uniref:3-hydroxy-3-methylglutaryl coenzyme A reductase n=1 Tax=Ignisphaera aggregans TaxID=334771 RepID=A0A7C2VD50_9CREN
MGQETKSSRIPGFYNLSLDDRLKIVRDWAALTDKEISMLKCFDNLDPKIAVSMSENVIGSICYPLSIATNFRINGKDYLIPMVTEEPSVVAAASNAARFMRREEGIKSKSDKQYMIAQIHVIKSPMPKYSTLELLLRKDEILDLANSTNKTLVNLGGGAKDLEVRILETRRGPVISVHLVVDVLDAMGANTVNTMAEAVAPLIEKITGGEARLKIVSNYAVYRLTRSWVRIPIEDVGQDVAEKIVDASAIAEADVYRAVTHNKGIMNGIIAVALATAQDHRAIEAGAHAYAARSGAYKPLSTWDIENGYLIGVLEIPLQIGIVGGATKTHPIARIALKILGVNSARELAEVMAAVGLAQNFAALRALVTSGIQAGHMKLHARNIAIMAGATGELIDIVTETMIREGKISYDYAKELIEKITQSQSK